MDLIESITDPEQCSMLETAAGERLNGLWDFKDAWVEEHHLKVIPFETETHLGQEWIEWIVPIAKAIGVKEVHAVNIESSIPNKYQRLEMSEEALQAFNAYSFNSHFKFLLFSLETEFNLLCTNEYNLLASKAWGSTKDFRQEQKELCQQFRDMAEEMSKHLPDTPIMRMASKYCP